MMEMGARATTATGGALSAAPGSIFARIAPITREYATQPVLEGFNWAECMVGVESGQWFLVTFQSVRKLGVDDAVLTAYDDLAFADALQTSGLLCYFRGDLNEHRQCLSFCIWENGEQAHLAARRPMHIAAAHLVKEMYESYTVGRHLLTTQPGVSEPVLLPVP